MENDPIQRQGAAGRNDPVAPAPEQGGPGQPQNVPAGPGAQNLHGPAGAANNVLGLMNRFLFGAPPAQAQPARPLGQLPNLVNAAAQPGGVLIQYNIQYQVLGGQQQQQPELIQPMTLQPAPQFRGFEGPGDAWHPWPQDAHRENQPDQEVGGQATTSTEQPEPSSSDLNISPREAAARAAARRMNGSSDSTNPPDSFPRPSHSQHLAPALIPLFEYDLQSSPSGGQDQRFDTPQVERHLSGTDSRVPTSSLAPLTDEQLVLMDQTTREAIDQRLKVLEGVSNAVYRCIDDLMRMRSALPPVESSSGAQSEVEPAKAADRAPLDPTPIETVME